VERHVRGHALLLQGPEHADASVLENATAKRFDPGRDIQLASCGSDQAQHFWFEAQPVVLATGQSYLKIHPRSGNGAICVSGSSATSPLSFGTCTTSTEPGLALLPLTERRGSGFGRCCDRSAPLLLRYLRRDGLCELVQHGVPPKKRRSNAFATDSATRVTRR
jgi:hypothetical protein